MTEKPRQIIKSMRLANHLLKQGFQLEEIRRDKHSSRNTVYFFVNSEELQKEVTEFINTTKYEGKEQNETNSKQAHSSYQEDK